MTNTSYTKYQVSTKPGLLRVRDYSQQRRRAPGSNVESGYRSAHSQSAFRKDSSWSLALKRTGFDDGASMRLRAASFIARSASIY